MEQGECLGNNFTKKTRDEFNIFEKRSPRYSLLVQAMVWNRTSHGLFDYEGENIIRSQVCFKNSGMVVRNEDKISFIDNNDSFGDIEDEEDDPKILSYIRQVGDDEYIVEPRDEATSLNNRIWLIIRSLKNQSFSGEYEVQPTDVIKLGRVVLQVTEMRNDFIDPQRDPDEEEFDGITTLKDKPQNEEHCRFCWGSEETDDNPKICPGVGTGSMRYIYYQCLKQWIDSRKNQKNSPGIYSIIWKNFDCEICKTPYPYAFMYRKKRWNLHTAYRPIESDVKYIVLESMKNERNSGRMVHTLIVSALRSEYRLGQGHESDVRVNDISVSRQHLKIKYKEGKFLTEDGGSKFGTLALVKNELEINTRQDKAIQVGRTMLNLSVKDNAGLFENPVFNDKTASKFFERKKEDFLPSFGGSKANKISENVDDMPEIDRIQNHIPHFGVHANGSVIKDNLLPRANYRVDPFHVNQNR